MTYLSWIKPCSPPITPRGLGFYKKIFFQALRTVMALDNFAPFLPREGHKGGGVSVCGGADTSHVTL